MTLEFALAMCQPIHKIVGPQGCLVLSYEDRHEAIALEALTPKRPSPSPVVI